MAFLEKRAGDIAVVWDDGAESREVPLVLAGPVLRRTEPDGVTVWVALKRPRTVQLSVVDDAGDQQLSGTAETVPLGEFLHVAAVTATGDDELNRGTVYRYALTFDPGGETLASPGVLTNGGATDPITYAGFDLPTFALPPADLDDLRLVHTSCRKPHAEGRDAFPAVDKMLAESASDANGRPHQLFLTGDQIYADDVADALLAVLTDAGNTLLGYEETLPFGPKDAPNDPSPVSAHEPGERQWTANSRCKLSSGHAKSHLFGLGEFYAMYLSTWSPTLWPPAEGLPEFESIYGPEPQPERRVSVGVNPPGGSSFDTDFLVLSEWRAARKEYAKEERHLASYLDELPAVRRLLANVPTYMIFDDHEVTDDWFLSGRWTKRAVGSEGGRRVLQNGLVAYSIFQGWGNSPEQFEPADGDVPEPGRALLDAVDVDPDSPAPFDRAGLDSLLAIPRQTGDGGSLAWPRESPDVSTMEYHFAVEGPGYEVVVFDTRTWRGFPADDDWAPPELLTASAFDDQLPTRDDVDVSFVVSAAPLMIQPTIHRLKKIVRFLGRIPILWAILGRIPGILLGEAGLPIAEEAVDYEDWDHRREAFERLLSTLAVRSSPPDGGEPVPVVFLSGDVHYGFGVKAQYWARQPFERPQEPETAVFVNLTASAAKNEEKKTRKIGHDGYDYLDWLDRDSTPDLDADPVPEYAWAGWNDPVGFTSTKTLLAYLRLREDPAVIRFTDQVSLADIASQPEWLYRTDYLDARPQLAARLADPRVQAALNAADPGRSREVEQLEINQRIVGQNNVGEVAFDRDDRTIEQTLWWWVTEDDFGADGRGGLCPMTTHRSTLTITDPPPQVDPSYPGGGT